ncbi:uncharacterized protein C1orf87 [Electrophorus electricus]|uniref:uncharacterized protein C1orf87 n=1 Tax=Electrophorus electricus TaxID=8005 RepID=UPI0015D04476|nr:uncharacterized protein C1orf87 [Electrophorus electricus]
MSAVSVATVKVWLRFSEFRLLLDRMRHLFIGLKVRCRNPATTRRAPVYSGDGSQSYRHRRSPAGNYTKAVQPQPQVTGRELQEGQDVRVEDWLILQASAELKGWKPHTLENIDEEFAPLDPSHMGTIHQSELTYLFLRRQVPLKLPTMASLLHTFSCSAHPEQVLYEKLLQFIQSLLPGQVAQSIEEIYVAPSETETWPQRFQKLESALHMCDSRNTGCIEKEQAQCLIESYNLTFDLGLSPLRVNEVIRKAQLGGRVHLATALLLLKNR